MKDGYYNIEETEISFEKVYQQPWFPEELADQVKKANCLIVPNNLYVENSDGLLFPETTTEFYRFLIAEHNNDFIADIAVNDSDYKKLELHSSVIEIATLVVEYLVLPVIVNMISNFLYDAVKRRRKRPDEMQAQIKIIVEKSHKNVKGERNIKITYKGPVSSIKESLMKAIETITEEKNG